MKETGSYLLDVLTWDVVEGVGMGVPGPVDQDGTGFRTRSRDFCS